MSKGGGGGGGGRCWGQSLKREIEQGVAITCYSTRNFVDTYGSSDLYDFTD